MRAAIFREMGKPLAIEALADPEPGPHELILKVKNCGICGSDLHMTEATSVMPLALGSVMGHEFAGEVVAVGSAATGQWKEGDRVAGSPYICCGEASPCRNLTFGHSVCGKGISIG